ncbi:hypothetical protein VCV18_011754 [Metarhizium anisopliae]
MSDFVRQTNGRTDVGAKESDPFAYQAHPHITAATDLNGLDDKVPPPANSQSVPHQLTSRSLSKVSSPTVTITAIPPTVTVTAPQQDATSNMTTLSTLIPTAGGNGSAPAGNVIPPPGAGFLVGVSGIAGGLLGIGAILFLWRRRARLKQRENGAAP